MLAGTATPRGCLLYWLSMYSTCQHTRPPQRTWSMSPCVADTVWSLSLILSVSQSTLRRVLAKMTDWVMARVSYRSHFVGGRGRGEGGATQTGADADAAAAATMKGWFVSGQEGQRTQHKAPHAGRGQLGAHAGSDAAAYFCRRSCEVVLRACEVKRVTVPHLPLLLTSVSSFQSSFSTLT